jgi:hypothetical protein
MKNIKTYEDFVNENLINEEINFKKLAIGAAIGASLLSGMTSCKKEDIKPNSGHFWQSEQLPIICYINSRNDEVIIHVNGSKKSLDSTSTKFDTLTNSNYTNYYYSFRPYKGDEITITLKDNHISGEMGALNIGTYPLAHMDNYTTLYFKWYYNNGNGTVTSFNDTTGEILPAESINTIVYQYKF